MPTKKTSAVAKPNADDNSELSLIRQLAEILNETGLTEIELDRKGTKVRVSKSQVHSHVSAAPAPQMYAPSAPVAAAASPVVAAAPAVSADAVKSPMVGTAYLTPSPGAPPFVAVGATVKQGQTILIIEAMKTMNQIAAPRSGKITQIFVDNAQPVEFGEALMVIE